MLTSNLIEGHTIKIVPADHAEKLEVIHYGDNTYHPSMLGVIANRNWIKPHGGLWTSPVDAENGWRTWCAEQNFGECLTENSFRLKFKPGTKITVIDSYSDLLALPKRIVPRPYGEIDHYLDFELIAKHIDAIWLTDRGQWATRNTHPMNLYGWDCESILILNRDCCYQIATVFPKPEKTNTDAESKT